MHDKHDSMNINRALVKEWEGYSISELLEAPLTALAGITEAQQAIFKSLGIKCIKDLGTWKYYLWARSICTLAEVESKDGTS